MNYTLLSGGVREGSSNNKLARYTYLYLNSNTDLTIDLFDNLVEGVPFVSETDDFLPEILIPTRASLINAHKVIVFSPIFNGGYAASLKNALDWLSLSFDSYKYNELYKDKKIAIMSSVLGKGGNSLDARNMLGHQLIKYGFHLFEESYLFTNAEERMPQLDDESSIDYSELANFLDKFILF